MKRRTFLKATASGLLLPRHMFARNPRGYGIGAVNPSPPSGIANPKLACTYIEGTFSKYNGAAATTYFGHMDDFIYNFAEGQQASNGFSAAQFCNTARAGSVRPAGSLPFCYYDPIFQNPGAALNQMRAAHQLLYAAYPSNLTEVPFPGSSNPCGNPCISGSQPTSIIGGVTRNASQFIGDFICDLARDGGARGLLQGNACAANPSGNAGLDDFWPYTENTADWERINSAQPAELGLTPPGSGPASLALRQGWAAVCSRIHTNHPGMLISVNMASMYLKNGGQSSTLTGISNAFDGGDMEASLGWSNSEDVSGGGWVSGMQTVQRCIAICNQPHHVRLNHINLTSDGRDFYRTTPYQASLYGLVSAGLVDAYYMPSPTGNNPNNVLTNGKGNSGWIDNLTYTGGALWFDEFAVNPVTLIAYTYNDPNIKLGAYWMGQLQFPAFDAIANPYQNTNVRHNTLINTTTGRITHLLLNFDKASGHSVTLPVNVQAFTGGQNPGVNNGATITAGTGIVLPPQSARILIQ